MFKLGAIRIVNVSRNGKSVYEVRQEWDGPRSTYKKNYLVHGHRDTYEEARALGNVKAGTR